MQHPSKFWILDPVCPPYPSTLPKNVTGSTKDPHWSTRNVYLMVKTHLSQGIFSEQDPVSPGSSSYFSRQDPRSTGSRKNCVDKIQDPLDPSTKCQPRIRQDSRSYILRILDPGYSLDLGTCLERSLDRIGPFIFFTESAPRSGNP